MRHSSSGERTASGLYRFGGNRMLERVAGEQRVIGERSVRDNGKGCLAGCRQPLGVDYDCSASANILHAAYFAGFGRVEGNVIILCHPPREAMGGKG